MSKWIEIGTLENAGGDIAVFRSSDDRVFALDDRCPHRGGPLSQGIVHGWKVTCPLHNWVIELANGKAVSPDEGCATKYPVRIKAGVISLQLSTRLITQGDMKTISS